MSLNSPSHINEPKYHQSQSRGPMLFEVAWEVCNKLGGIYTVIRSKIPAMVERWGNRYVLIGPYHEDQVSVEFEPMALTGTVGQAVKLLREQGVGAHYGRWLVTGRPRVVLLDYLTIFDRLHDIKYQLWNDHGISAPGEDELINNVIAFGSVCQQFLMTMASLETTRKPLLAHFHEWMAGTAIPGLRKQRWPGGVVFTTHATLLGRYLAMHDDQFYSHLKDYAPEVEAKHFNIQTQYGIERAAAHGAHVFTTVSDVTADECEHLLGRRPELLLPNGLNIKRFTADHEFQNLHRINKEKIHEFTIGHFFPSYSFDLDKTLYYYTSGRYEYKNKGMDITIESLARLNHWLKASNSDVTVVAFIITKRPFYSMNVEALSTSAMRGELLTVTKAIQEQIGERLFHAAASGELPDLNTLVDEYWRLRLKRTIHAWKRKDLPAIVTHNLVDDQKDEVLRKVRACGLWNQPDNPVKIIYHPDFISPTNPLFGLEYDEFVRGCHLGIFPSYYEPWGYTPLESAASGVAAITSDLSGFGSYINNAMPDHNDHGMYVVRRRDVSWSQSVEELTHYLFRYTQFNRRQRVALRSSVESASDHFDWSNLGQHYQKAHELAISRIG